MLFVSNQKNIKRFLWLLQYKNICDEIEQEDSIEEFSVLLSYVVAITEIVLCSFDSIQITHFLNMVFNHYIMTSISSILTNAAVYQSNRTNRSNNRNILEDIQFSSLLLWLLLLLLSLLLLLLLFLLLQLLSFFLLSLR